MSRKQKIIISITGIFIVLLALIGLTYGYFLTQIKGNGNNKSISVTTKYLELVYDDGTPIIEGTTLEPITSDNIKTKAVKKTFSIAKAEKSDDIYAKLEMADIVISDNLKDYDFKWALYQGETKITTGTFIQAMSSNRIVLANNILVDSTTPTEYDLYIWIDETGMLQNHLMGGSLTARIEPSGTGEELRTLASLLLGDNNENVTTTAPTFSETSTDRGLFVQQSASETDEKSEYGFPTYYFRGSSENETINSTYKINNYVKFGRYQTNDGDHIIGTPIIWKVVRINEDGTIKLISEEAISPHVAWDSTEPYSSNYLTSEIKPVVENWYENNIAINPNLDSKVVTSSFCNDISGNYNAAYNRITNNKPIFTCPNGAEISNSKIGMITADETIYAGTLYNNTTSGNNSYLSGGTDYFWTLTPYNASYLFFRHDYYLKHVISWNMGYKRIRAVINLSADVLVSGGTGLSADDPYIIDIEGGEPKVFEIASNSRYQSSYYHDFSIFLSTISDGSTIKLGDGTYDLRLDSSYGIPKDLTIIGNENTIVRNIYVNTSNASDTGQLIYDTNVIEGLTISNIKFTDTGIHSAGYLKNLTIKDCTFEDGASIRLGLNDYHALLTNENIVINNNRFTGTKSSYSHVHIGNNVGITKIENNNIDGGFAGVLLTGNISGTVNINNNTISNTSNVAFRIATLNENANINVTGNIISNAILPASGAIAHIGNKSDLPASATIKFTNNTYGGTAWVDSTWSNVQGEFGVNIAGNQVEIES